MTPTASSSARSWSPCRPLAGYVAQSMDPLLLLEQDLPRAVKHREAFSSLPAPSILLHRLHDHLRTNLGTVTSSTTVPVNKKCKKPTAASHLQDIDLLRRITSCCV